jgi:hypothetical protein
MTVGIKRRKIRGLLRADFVVEVAGEPGPDRMSGISRPAAGKNATFTFRN